MLQRGTVMGWARLVRVRVEEVARRVELLRNHASNAEHGNASDDELLAAEVALGREAEGVEADVARDAALLVERVVAALLSGALHVRDVGRRLDEANRADDNGQEGLERRGLEGDQARLVDRAAPERVEDLGDRVTERGQHSNAGVLNLGLLDPVYQVGELLLRERLAEGVGEALLGGPAVGARHVLERRDVRLRRRLRVAEAEAGGRRGSESEDESLRHGIRRVVRN